MKQTLLLPSNVVLDCYTVSSLVHDETGVAVDPRTAEAVTHIKDIVEKLTTAGLREVGVSFQFNGHTVPAGEVGVTYTNNQGQQFSCEHDPEGTNIVVGGVSDEILRDVFEQMLVTGNSRNTLESVVAARKVDELGYTNNGFQRQWKVFYTAARGLIK